MAGSTIVEPAFDPDLFDIRHVIDVGLDAAQTTRAPRTSDRWAAGSIGYCLRRQFYERAGVPKTRKDTSGYRTLWVGDLIHHGVKQRMRQAGLLLIDELHLVDEVLQVSGYVDMIWGGEVPEGIVEGEEDYSPTWQDYLVAYRRSLRLLYDDRPFPITGDELKSAAQYSADKMFSQGPSFHHVMQAATYAVMWEHRLAANTEVPERLEELGIDRWRLTVLAKSDLKMPVFEILPSQIDRARERIEELNDLWASKTVPPCTCGQNLSWEPKYCPYLTGATCCGSELIEFATAPAWVGEPDASEADAE